MRQLRRNHTQNAVHIVPAHLCSELYEPIREQETGEDIENDDDAILEATPVSDRQQNAPGPDHTREDTELYKIEIYLVQVRCKATTDQFLGACIDSGAQRTVIGRKQADSYSRQVVTEADSRDNQKYA